ncbi:MAG TPA: STAS domain-containing protein [Allosphingosinicella sp.]|nr:STAS domain-containing protein [Allosphingosinicella sp.]
MIEVEQSEGLRIIRFSESRLDAANAPNFRTSVAGAMDDKPDRVLLDMEEVQFLDSTGLGTLVSILKMMGPNGVLAISGAQPAVKRLLEITRMNTVFRLFETRQDAEQALRS